MDFAQQVKAAVNIVDVVGEAVRLRKQGPNRWTGLCPFHTEKTPSFSVHEGLQIYKCFGCGKGGDIFAFLMELQGLSFFEALTGLAESHGIPIPRRSGAGLSDEETRKRANLHRMHEIAGEFFSKQLAGPAGAAARRYLESRGLSPQEAETFGLGYAPGGGEALVRTFRGAGLPEDQWEESGLALRRREGPGFFDRFRDRLIFPIQNERGKVIAFAGRALRSDQKPKYMNSPETPIYKKSSVLYNLNRARESIRSAKRAVLVEGYLDVIGAHRAGVVEVVASCGTALTQLHARTLRRHVDTLVVNFDPDGAGQAAAERSIQVLLQEGVGVSVLSLPEGLDPYEFVRVHGKESYQAVLHKAADYFSWLADRARKQFDMRTSAGRSAAFDFLLPSIQLVPDKIRRASLAHEVAAQVGIERGLVLEQFKRLAIERRGAKPAGEETSLLPGEMRLVQLLMESADARRELLPQTLEMAAQEGLASRPLLVALAAVSAESPELSYASLEARLSGAERELLSRLTFDPNPRSASLEEGSRDYAAVLRESKKRRHRALSRKIGEAEKAGERTTIPELLQAKRDLERELGLLAGREAVGRL